MELTQLTPIISSLGFPIAACIALFYYLNKERENHKEEIETLRNCINENNTVLSALKTLLESIERRLDNLGRD